jgi:SAM-dependent methyltransferase
MSEALARAGERGRRLEESLDELYRHRFPAELLKRRRSVWKVLCEIWFSRYIARDARVLEIAAGYCEFINNVQAAHKVAVDLNPETPGRADPGVAVHIAAAESVHKLFAAETFDAAFMSNFLEHCRSRDQVLEVLRSVRSVLRPGGRLLILGPNFRACYKHYFDFFDHYLPLTEKAVAEALEVCGYDIEELKPRTLPLTFAGPLPSWPWLVALYLRLAVLWPIFGAQFFIVARKR